VTWAVHVYSDEDLGGSRLRHSRLVGVVARLGGWLLAVDAYHANAAVGGQVSYCSL
jgi:hypothetical protein